MQTQLWCTRCERIMDIDLKIKKMGRGKVKLAQLLSICPKCRSTLHTQTTRLAAAEEALRKFEELRGGKVEEVETEGSESEATGEEEDSQEDE